MASRRRNVRRVLTKRAGTAETVRLRSAGKIFLFITKTIQDPLIKLQGSYKVVSANFLPKS